MVMLVTSFKISNTIRRHFTMDAIKAAKGALRKQIENKIGSLSTDEKSRQTEHVLRQLFDLPVFKNSKRVSVFLSTADEISTTPILKTMFEQEKLCYVPRYNKAVMEMVKLNSMADYDSLPLTKWNIKQPNLSEDRENALRTGGLDLVIVPGVAFTSNGGRLGHGKGYYDSFLHLLTKEQAHKPTTVALAFKEQIVEEVPLHEHDVKIDYILYSN